MIGRKDASRGSRSRPMINTPWLSVLMPTYNGAPFLTAALDSIASQVVGGIECIAVDDGSRDSTVAILERYQDRIPLTIKVQPRTGNWVMNTNRALALARGEYACFLHQDDIWRPGRLVALRRLIDQNPGVDLILGSADFIDAKGKALGPWRCPLRSGPPFLDPSEVTKKLLVQNFVPIPAPIFKSAEARKYGGMDENLWYTADWDFWLKLASGVSALYYAPPLVGFRVHPHSQTMLRSSDPNEFRAQHRLVIERHLSRFPFPDQERARIRRISQFSIEVNTALAKTLREGTNGLSRLFLPLFSLGPAGVLTYLRNSRILERGLARIRAGLA